MSVDLSQGICAYLTGGFGNQMFVAATGLAVSRRLGCPLYLDASGLLGPNETRAFALGGVDFGATVLAEDSPWWGDNPGRGTSAAGRLRRIVKPAPSAVYRQPHFGYDPAIVDVRPGTTLFGYFQSWRYFHEVAEELRDKLNSARLSPADKAFIAESHRPDSVTVHVRRGDYLNAATITHHGITERRYFELALSVVTRMRGLPPTMRVFSDSPVAASDELSGLGNAEIMPVDDGVTDLATVLSMSTSDGMIMSNSSFSWWAAWLMSARDPAAPIVAPRPWFASGGATPDLLPAHWLTLGIRGE